MLSGEKGPISDKLLNTSFSMLEKYKTKLAEVKTMQRDILSGNTAQGNVRQGARSSQSNDSSKKMAANLAANQKMLRSYVSAMDSLQQSFVRASVKNSQTGQLGTDYKKVAGMYKSMRTEFQKMLSGEKGPVTNKLLNTSLSMLEKYKAKLIEVETLQRNILSGSATQGSAATPLTQVNSKTMSAGTQKYLSQMQRVYN